MPGWGFQPQPGIVQTLRKRFVTKDHNTHSKKIDVSVVVHEPHLQLPVSIQPISIRTLWVDRSQYDNYPAYQRNRVWPLRFKQELIESILRGHPIPAIITSRRIDTDMISRQYIIDGQQRMKTLWEYRNGDFATASAAMRQSYEPYSIPPVEPRKTYQQLSLAARNAFDNYQFVFQIYEHIDDVTAGEIFRKLQHQIPLTSGEKLNTYISRANTFARNIQDLPFWLEMYSGRKSRQDMLQSALMLLLMEVKKDVVDLSSKRITNLASGAMDAEMTEELYEQVEERLFLCQHVFAGATIQNRTDLIPMYQATILLEKAGVTFTTTNQASLTKWFFEVIRKSAWGGQSGFASPIHRLIELRPQREFWDAHLPRLVEQFHQAQVV